MAIAGLALFGTIANGLNVAMENGRQREAARITFLVTASGVSLFGVGTAFWGLVAGALALLVFNWKRPSANDVKTTPSAMQGRISISHSTAQAASHSTPHSS